MRNLKLISINQWLICAFTILLTDRVLVNLKSSKIIAIILLGAICTISLINICLRSFSRHLFFPIFSAIFYIFVFTWHSINTTQITIGLGILSSLFLLSAGISLRLSSPNKFSEFNGALKLVSVFVIGYAIAHAGVVLKIIPSEYLFMGFHRIDILRISGIWDSPLQLGPFITFISVWMLLFGISRNSVTIQPLWILFCAILTVLTGNRSTSLTLLLGYILLASFGYISMRVFLVSCFCLILSFALFWYMLEPVVIAQSLSRAMGSLAVLAGISTDQSYDTRFSNNALNFSEFLRSPINFFLGMGKVPIVTDSDFLSVLFGCGAIFFSMYFGMIFIFGIIIPAWRISRTTMPFGNCYRLVYVAAIVLTVQKLAESFILGGAFSPSVASFYFFFIGAMVGMKPQNGKSEPKELQQASLAINQRTALPRDEFLLNSITR